MEVEEDDSVRWEGVKEETLDDRMEEDGEGIKKEGSFNGGEGVDETIETEEKGSKKKESFNGEERVEGEDCVKEEEKEKERKICMRRKLGKEEDGKSEDKEWSFSGEEGLKGGYHVEDETLGERMEEREEGHKKEGSLDSEEIVGRDWVKEEEEPKERGRKKKSTEG